MMLWKKNVGDILYNAMCKLFLALLRSVQRVYFCVVGR